MAESDSQPPAHDEIHAIPPEGATDKERASSPPIAPLAPETPPPPPHYRERQHCRPDQTPLWKYTLEYVAAVCGIALVIITAYYTRAAYRQAVASETAANAARDAVKVARDTLTETQAANSQQRIENTASLQATIDNFHTDQRAWVSLKNMGFEQGTLKNGDYISAKITLTNTGKTPALNVAIGTTANIYTYGQEPRIFRVHQTEEFNPFQVIYPNDIPNLDTERIKDTHGADAILNDTERAQLISGQLIFYVSARILYSDVSGARHTTQFCAVMNPDLTSFHECKQKYAYTN
jgi:uncharacterized Zn finger protein (UPF0148 family)